MPSSISPFEQGLYAKFQIIPGDVIFVQRRAYMHAFPSLLVRPVWALIAYPSVSVDYASSRRNETEKTASC